MRDLRCLRFLNFATRLSRSLKQASWARWIWNLDSDIGVTNDTLRSCKKERQRWQRYLIIVTNLAGALALRYIEVREFLNPLSPKVNIQIFQADLRTLF